MEAVPLGCDAHGRFTLYQHSTPMVIFSPTRTKPFIFKVAFLSQLYLVEVLQNIKIWRLAPNFDIWKNFNYSHYSVEELQLMTFTQWTLEIKEPTLVRRTWWMVPAQMHSTLSSVQTKPHEAQNCVTSKPLHQSEALFTFIKRSDWCNCLLVTQFWASWDFVWTVLKQRCRS